MSKDKNDAAIPVREFKLPSGRTASTLEFPLGRHHREAGRIAGKDGSMMTFALVASTTTVEGRAVTAEELLDFPLADWLMLAAEVVGGKAS